MWACASEYAHDRLECVRLLLVSSADVRPVGEERPRGAGPACGESAIDLAEGDGFWVPRREEVLQLLRRHRLGTWWGRVRRQAASVGKLVLFMQRLYANVHYRPHHQGAPEDRM